MIVYCEVTLYDIHFYATLVRDEKRVTLKYYLTNSIRTRLARADVIPHSESDYHRMKKSERFLSEKRVRGEAIRQYKKIFPGATILVFGYRHHRDEPQEILDGPEELKEAINALVEEARKNKHWDGDQETMKRINRQYREIYDASWLA